MTAEPICCQKKFYIYHLLFKPNWTYILILAILYLHLKQTTLIYLYTNKLIYVLCFALYYTTSITNDEYKNNNKGKNKEIIIDLPFEDDLIFDNLKDINYNFRLAPGESFPSYESFEKHISYYNFNTLSWDYKYITDLGISDYDFYGVNFAPPVVPSSKPLRPFPITSGK